MWAMRRPYGRFRYEKFDHIVPLVIINRSMAPCLLTPDDRDFLIDNLPGNQQLRARAKANYREIWIAAMLEQPIEHEKQNSGRFAANCWLREHWRKGYPI